MRINMKFINGYPKELANQTLTSRELMKYAIAEPEFLPQVATLFSNQYTAFTSLLANKGLISGNLYSDANPKSKNYRVVGNRKVMWPVSGQKLRKGKIVTGPDGATFVDSFNQTTEPGKGGAPVKVYIDTDWFSPMDVLELDDRRTQVHYSSLRLPDEVAPHVFEITIKLVGKDKSAYIPPSLLEEGKEIGWLYTAFKELSETGYEKYTFNDTAYCYMTIQRMKWSISGTAEEMRPNQVWVEHNGEKLVTTYQDIEMLERWSIARENQIIFGKGTVDEKDNIYLKDMENKDIIIGDGLLEQGEGSFRMPYNGLNKKVLHNVMKNMQLFSNNEGVTEVAVLAGQDAMWDFHDLMVPLILGSGSGNKVIEGEGSSKGINLDVEYYQYANVRFIPVWYRFFDNPSRPQSLSINGRNPESSRMIFVSLGNTGYNQPNVELLALGKRSFIRGEVNGMNKGGEMANSVDGRHVQVISETGIALKNPEGLAELFVPYSY